MVTDLELWRAIAISVTCNVVVYAIIFWWITARSSKRAPRFDEQTRRIKRP
jgi:hypothetical protein